MAQFPWKKGWKGTASEGAAKPAPKPASKPPKKLPRPASDWGGELAKEYWTRGKLKL